MTSVRREPKSLNAKGSDDVTAKEYLMRIRNLDGFINAKIKEKSELEKQMTCLKSVQFGEKVKTSCSDNAQKTIDKIIDMRNEIDEEIDKLVDLKREVREKINRLSDNRFKSVLIDYYINGMTFDEIAEDIKYSRIHTIRIYGNALDVFEKMILNDIE